MLVRLLQLLNVESWILVTGSGMVMLVRLLQSRKAAKPMLDKPSGTVTLVRLVHSLNDDAPTLVTLSGIETPVSRVQPRKALFPILMTGFPSMLSGMTSVPEAEVSQSVMVTSLLVVV